MLDVMFGALAQAIPEQVPAAPFGTIGVVTVGGVHPDLQRFFVGVFPYPGGYGATPDGDGLVNGTPPISMANFVALEASEHRYPLMFEYFALRENTRRRRAATGRGRHHLPDPAVVGHDRLGDGRPPRRGAVRLGRRRVRPTSNDVVFTSDGEDRVPPMRTKLARQTLHRWRLADGRLPGGGGHGDPLTRPAEEVERDLNLGYITPESAERDFGVVIAERWTVGGHDRFRLDPERTQPSAARERNTATAV